jgi:predicted O-linked N-acetylglucosamine transferase (SPINDLY family)
MVFFWENNAIIIREYHALVIVFILYLEIVSTPFISRIFASITETHAILPLFEHLDKTRFEVFLYTIKKSNAQMERYCASRVDHFKILPESLGEKVTKIRHDELDILIFGTNITFVSHDLYLLALHRLALIQTTNFIQPCSTGISTMDYFIVGTLLEKPDDDGKRYVEKLSFLNGPGLCFSFPDSKENADRFVADSDNNAGTIFVSGANFFKLIPELLDAWGRILAKVANARLILFPFGPAWSNSYPRPLLLQNIHRHLSQKHNIAANRIELVGPFQSKQEILKMLETTDIYLDAFPYTGATSLLDPLAVGVPPVVYEGDELRFRQGSAIIRDLEIPELISTTSQSYIDIAVELAKNDNLRRNISRKISKSMQAQPRFLDSKRFGQQISNLFEEWMMGEKLSGPSN